MTTLTTISNSTSGKDVQASENFIATSVAGAFGRKVATTTGLTWGYYGGYIHVDGVQTSVSDGTLALVNATTSYIEISRAGTVSANTTGFTAGRRPLYSAVTSGNVITSYTDFRTFDTFTFGRLSVSVAGSSDVTLTAAQARNNSLHLTGVLTGSISVIVPTQAGLYWVNNSTTGAFTLTVKTSAGTGVLVGQGYRVPLLCDGTNVIRALTDPLAQDIAYAASITPDASAGERITVGTLTGGPTINAPTNPRKGGKLCFAFLVDGTGGYTITWNAAFKKAADGTLTANGRGATEFVYDGTNWIQLGGALAVYT